MKNTTFWAIAFAASLTAQKPDADPAPEGPPSAQTTVREIVAQNLTPHPRREWVRATVPFLPGKVPAGTLPRVQVRDHTTIWQPLGGRWPDGSLRFASCLFRPTLSAGATSRFALTPRETTATLPDPTTAPPSFELEVSVVLKGGEPVTVKPEPTRVLVEGPVRQVQVLEARVGETGIVAQLTLEFFLDQEHVGFGAGVFFSDPTTDRMQVEVERIEVRSHGVAMVLRHAARFRTHFEHDTTGSRAVLVRDCTLGDGMGVRRTGVLLPPADPKDEDSLRSSTLRAAAVAPALAAVNWRGSGAFGPFGFTPPTPPWIAGAETATLAARHQQFVADSRNPGDPFGPGPLGLTKQPGQTGDQADFGMVQLEPVAATGIPSFLLEVEASVLQEGCRPVHYFEADGSPVRAVDHPAWVVWSGRTHWHCGVSKDRLGKPCPEPRFDRRGWLGKDRQHWSSNYMCALGLLMHEPQVLLEIENETQIYLAAQTVQAGVTTSGAGAPRGAGRTLRSACWLWLVNGDEALLERIRARILHVYAQQWTGRDLPEGRVRTMAASRPDARLLGGKYDFWNPWQDALAATGFEAVARVTGGEGPGGAEARRLARQVARNMLRFGWMVDNRGAAMVATAIRFKEDGIPLTDEEKADGVLWSYGTAFSTWSIGALEIARHDAIERGDEAAQRLAEELLRRLRASRGRPPNGWFDRFGQWDGIRFGN